MKTLAFCQTFDCDVATLWQKWTMHEGLLTFFGYDNRCELRIDGPFEIYFVRDNDQGQKGSENCKILSYLPEKMLSFSWNAPPQFPNIREYGPHTWVVITFDALSENTTQLILTHLGFLNEDHWQGVYNYFDEAWPRVMTSLAESLV